MAFKTPQAIIQAEQQFQSEIYRAVAMALESGHVGEWASDHSQEAKSYSGWNYLAIAAIGRLAAQAVPYVYSTAKPGASAMRKSLQSRYKGIWKSFADDGAADTVPEEHWVSRLVSRPNPSQTPALFQWEYVQQMHLHGACIIFNRPNKTGNRIVERYIVPMALTQPIYPGQERNSPNGGIRVMTYAAGLGYFVHPLIRTLSGAVIPAEMLSILRYPHPVLRGDGKSPTDAAGWWIDTALMTDMARWKQVKRGPRPHGVVTVKGQGGSAPTPEFLDQVEKRLNRKLGDESFDQRVIAVGDGTQVPNETTPKDMDYVNAFSQLGQAILAVHGASKAMVGLTDNMTYGSLAAALRQSASVVQSDMDILGDDYTLLAEVYGETVEVQFEVPTYEDPQLLEQQLSNDLTAGVRKGREWRAIRGLPPFGDWRDEARVTAQGFVRDTDPSEQHGAAAGMEKPSFASFDSLKGDTTAAKSMQRLGGYAQGILAKSGQTYATPAEALAAIGRPRPSVAKSYRKPGFSWDSGNSDNPSAYRRPIVAVDLDGTLAQETKYFDEQTIGEPIPAMVEDVRRLKEAGCQICIFTCRDNDDVVAAWLDAAGVPWDAINAQPIGFEGSSKIFADVYWDNRALNADEGLRAVAKRLPDGEAKRRLLASTERSSDLGCIMVEMPEAVCRMVQDEQARISPESLRDEGLETWPHITLLYGVVGASPREVIDSVRRIDQFEVTFGGVSTFDQPTGVSVLKVDIESPAILKANERLKAALPVQETYPTYIPHMTLAYVDGSSPEALNAPCECALTGRVARVTHAVVSMDGEKIRVPLRQAVDSEPVETMPRALAFMDADSLLPGKPSVNGKPTKLRKKRPSVTLAGDAVAKKFNPNQPRDDHGRFVATGKVREAARSVGKAAELFKDVTQPDQQTKLVKFLQDNGMSKDDAEKAMELGTHPEPSDNSPRDGNSDQHKPAAPKPDASKPEDNPRETPDWLNRVAAEKEAEKPKKPRATKEKLPAGEKPRKYKSGNDAEKLLGDYSKQWHEGLDFDQQMGLRGYAGSGDSFLINKQLRAGKFDNPRHKENAKRVEVALEKASFPERAETYRTINVATPEERQAILSKFEESVGKSIVDKAFVSTTANKKYAQEWAKRSKVDPIQVQVIVPKGAKAAYLSKEVIGRPEWEVLIQRNSKFKVHSVKDGVVSLELE